MVAVLMIGLQFGAQVLTALVGWALRATFILERKRYPGTVSVEPGGPGLYSQVLAIMGCSAVNFFTLLSLPLSLVSLPSLLQHLLHPGT